MKFKVILYSNVGRIIISIILGLGVACLFHRVCKDKDCIRFSGPVISNIEDKIFQHDGKCYTYKAKSVKCDSTKKTVDFGVEPTQQSQEKNTNITSLSSLSSTTFTPSFFTSIK